MSLLETHDRARQGDFHKNKWKGWNNVQMNLIQKDDARRWLVLKTDIWHHEIAHKKINENGGMISWAVRWKFKSNQTTIRGERMIALSFSFSFSAAIWISEISDWGKNFRWWVFNGLYYFYFNVSLLAGHVILTLVLNA